MEQPSVTVEALKGKGLVVCEFCLFGWGVLVGWLGGLFCCLFFFFFLGTNRLCDTHQPDLPLVQKSKCKVCIPGSGDLCF